MKIPKFKELVTQYIRNIQMGYEGRCKGILGSEYALVEMSKVWELASGHLHLIATHLIVDKTTKSNLTKDEIKLYKQGITDILKFIADCNEEQGN